jgi:hypothetical protein
MAWRSTGQNAWQHVCGVRRSSGLATIYLDGAQNGDADQDSGTPGLFGDISIGNNGNDTDFFNGLIDEVRIYNRALSAGEVNRLYQMGR